MPSEDYSVQRNKLDNYICSVVGTSFKIESGVLEEIYMVKAKIIIII